MKEPACPPSFRPCGALELEPGVKQCASVSLRLFGPGSNASADSAVYDGSTRASAIYEARDQFNR